MTNRIKSADVLVVGGGVAGLTAAAYLARTGRKVVLFEKSETPGGRARTENQSGFQFNVGPHALYAHGAAAQAVRELGVEFKGRKPPLTGGFAIARDVKHTLPSGFVSLLTTGLFNLPAKLETARWLGGIGKLRADAIQHLTVREWLEREIRQPDVRDLFLALIRVSSYASDPDRQSAGAAIAQLQEAFSEGVLYLDDGWQSLVNGLRAAAETAGTTIITGTRVTEAVREASSWCVRTADNTEWVAPSVIIAAAPAEASEIVQDSEQSVLAEWKRKAIPVRAACMDVALKSLPQPRAIFGLGIDRPLYFSVHSATARLAPGEGAMIHAMKYLGTDMATDAKVIEHELEALFDLMQPGWRELVVHKRFLPKLTVSNALVTAAQKGFAGRASVAVPGFDGLFVAGDWVGEEGQLADASFASAKRAAEMILQQQKRSVAAA